MNSTIEETVDKREQTLKLAEESSVAEACQQSGMSSSQLYVWRERYRRYGREGLYDRPPIHHNHPAKKSYSVEDTVLKLALANPMTGCHPLAKILKTKFKIDIHGVTVQSILNKNNLRSQNDRIVRVEELIRSGRVNLTRTLIKQISRVNTNFREYYNIGMRPGDLIVLDWAIIGDLPLIGRLFLTIAIDTYSNYVWARVHNQKLSVEPASLMYEKVHAQLSGSGIPIRCIQTSNDPIFTEADSIKKENDFKYLILYIVKMKHEVIERPKGERNGQVEHFLNSAREQCFRPLLRRNQQVEETEFQPALDAFMTGYNILPQDGFPLYGRSPLSTISDGKQTASK